MDNDLLRPDLVLQRLASEHGFHHSATLLARVEGARAAPVVASTELWTAPPLDEDERTPMVERALARLGLPVDRRPEGRLPLVVPVVVRPGPCWWSWDEAEVCLGLRYAFGMLHVRQTEPYVVTEKGWYAAFSGTWDVSPAATWTSVGGGAA